MKKILLFVAVALFAAVVPANAQKYGHVNSSSILEVMPGVDSLQFKLQAFQKDLQAMYESMMNEYQTKKDKFDRACAKCVRRNLRISVSVFRNSRPMPKTILRKNSMSWPSRSRMPSKTPSTRSPRRMAMHTSSTPRSCSITKMVTISLR